MSTDTQRDISTLGWLPDDKEELAKWYADRQEMAIRSAINHCIADISLSVQTAMLLGGVSEGVFASVVQSIESYRLP